MMIRAWRHAVIALLEMIWWILMMVLFQFMKVLALVRQNLTQLGTYTFQTKKVFHPLRIKIPRRKANQGSQGKCQASESPETENPPGVKLQLLLHHRAGDPVEAEVTTGKVIEMKAADLLRLQLGPTGKTWMMCSLLISLGLQDGGTLCLACLLRLVLLLQDGGTLYPACLIHPIPLLHKGEVLCLVPGPAIPDHKGAPTRILPANLRVSVHTYFQVLTILLHLFLYFFNADFSIAPFPMVRLDNRTNTVCWFNSSVFATIFLAKSCNLPYPPAEKHDSFMDYFSMWYNQENSHLFYPNEAIRHLIEEMTDENVEDALHTQLEATLFFTAVGGTEFIREDLVELPPAYGGLEPGLEFFKFMKPSIGETTMSYRCRHCQEKGNAKICCSGTVFSLNWQLVNLLCSSGTEQCSYIVFVMSCCINLIQFN